MLECEFVQIDYSGALSPKEQRALEHQAAYSLLNKMLSAKGILDYEISRNENGNSLEWRNARLYYGIA